MKEIIVKFATPSRGTMMTSILIVDDHDLFREGLRRIIEHWQDFCVVGEAPNGEEAIRLARKLNPDIILMDIYMPILNGLETTQALVQEFPNIKIIILTASDENDDLFKAINYGASGYILKNIEAQKLLGLLQDVVKGEAALSSLMATKIMNKFKLHRGPESLEAKIAPLTPRERLVLNLVAQGLTNAEIAEKIFLSEHSVKKIICGILQKLHLNNRVEAAVYAVREGMVKDEKSENQL